MYYLVCRYGVVTCYSLQMFIFMIFVGMVLSGSYPVVRTRCAANVNPIALAQTCRLVVSFALPVSVWRVSCGGAPARAQHVLATGLSQQKAQAPVLCL